MDCLVESAVEMMEQRSAEVGRQDASVPGDEGELIEGPERVTFILHSPGYWEEDLRVSVSGGMLEVKAPGLAWKRRIPAGVDESLIDRAYTNGVLSVTLRKPR